MDDKRYVFTANSVHELHTMAKKLYLAFSQADKTVIDSRNSWSHSSEVDYSLHPWDYYSCQIGTNECHIHKHRNGTYSVQYRRKHFWLRQKTKTFQKYDCKNHCPKMYHHNNLN